MTDQEIRDSIQKEMNVFMQKPFPAILPAWFLINFDKAVMEMPQVDVPYRGDTIQSILKKKNEELTFFETGLVVNIWLTVSPKFVDSKIDKYISKKIILEGIRAQWNMLNNTESERLQRKASVFARANGNRIIHN